MKKEIGKKTIFGMSNNFSEQDIRPRDLLDGQQRAILQDIEFLASRTHDFVEVNCPACAENDFTVKYKKYGFRYTECRSCKTFYTNPRPNAELLGKFYARSANYEYWNKYIFPASEKTRREKIFKPRVDKMLELCRKYNSQMNSLLEVGAGFGTFCEELGSRKIFKKILAVEPTPGLAETCRNKGIETIEKPIEQIHLEEKDRFDVIVNFEVIEHIFSPRDLILQCKKNLKPGGLFLVTCPNGQGFDVLTLGTVSNTVDHEHLNYFNPGSLPLLLEKCGFEVLEVLTPGVLDTDLVRNAVLEGKYSLDEQPFLKKILLDEWNERGATFQDYLKDNKLSSNMWVVAKNK